ncbi:DUF2690 domain-containing protein [Nonomuraea sp. NPDC001636]|uniref:DUF2690 domain-containing protein n=1 Tax=Nonomuraea sp. NPDC001636 TaxID=3154391 RepID=UPI00332B32D1
MAYAQDGPGHGQGDQSPTRAVKDCSRSGCNGEDPVIHHCSDDARTTYRYPTRLGLLELRYSPACTASWARITGAAEGTWFYVQSCRGAYTQTYQVPAGYNNAYTDMVPGSSNLRVGNHAGHSACTGPSEATRG